MRTAIVLAAALLTWAPACTSSSSDSSDASAVKRTPAQISLLNPGIAVGLRVEVRDAAHVLAHLSFTNHTAEEFWLYKPLMGEGPVWEECFYVLRNDADRHNLPYLGPHAEEYLGKPVGLIFIKPVSDTAAFLRLAPGATHKVTKNLSEVFDFEHNRGSYLLAYGGYMPAMRDGKQRFEADSLDPDEFKPVYYDISFGDIDDLANYHKKFIVN